MSRLLPLLAWQARAREPEEGVAALAERLTGLLADFPETRLVVLPEYHLTAVHGTPDQRVQRYRELVEPIDGERVTELREVARDLGIWLVPGTFPEAGPNGELYNSTVLLGPDGGVHGVYRKIFPWRPFEPFDMGTGFTVADVDGIGRVGFAICYDLWFPEVIRQLAWLGAELVILPTQTSTRDREQELVLARAAAIANQVFVLSLNAATPSGVGRSLLVDPEGRVRWQAPSEVAGVYTDVIDLDEVSRVREHGTCALNRMWHQFGTNDPEILLPAYGGSIRPGSWLPGSRRDAHGTDQ
ncbi:putative amidohydrolase [Kineosphaera limosa]|uniref:Putative hydrolase n=1 Tax=Kineosphaera limosa NBRC 100340 TaxID=1184609 RepID=K6WUE0_9MICO|nr:carbon-nitrogen hydrolase family protein [Kineosphaera limosa]NYE01661.1 putative amidohydrolase [Kineosphaera limosa]GAB97446.1 putative hydrolase [Kineosphaera limosa NBRC 100340]